MLFLIAAYKKENSAPKGFYHFMVKRFYKESRELTSRVWAREIKIAKKLFNKYPDVCFWNKVDLGFSLNSLAWLLSKEGNYALNIQRRIINSAPVRNKTYEISKRKFGKDKKITKRNKTLMEILNESKKN